MYPSPTSLRLNVVDEISASDVWAMGDDGIILHWDGSNWSTVTSPTDAFLSVSIVSATNAWAVAYNGNYHWDGLIGVLSTHLPPIAGQFQWCRGPMGWKVGLSEHPVRFYIGMVVPGARLLARPPLIYPTSKWFPLPLVGGRF